MKNRSAVKLVLIMSCILAIGMILLSIWYSRSLEEEPTSFKKGAENVVTETPSNARTPKTTVHATRESDSAAVHIQQTTDGTPPLIEQETPLQEKTSPDKFDSEDFQSDEERKLDEEFERILERIVAEQPTQEEIATQARTLIVEAREAAPIADRYTRQIHELVNQKPVPPDMWEQLRTLREKSRPYIQTLAEAHWFLNDENTENALGEWVKEEAEEIFGSLDWWSVGPTIPIDEWRRKHGGDR